MSETRDVVDVCRELADFGPDNCTDHELREVRAWLLCVLDHRKENRRIERHAKEASR